VQRRLLPIPAGALARTRLIVAGIGSVATLIQLGQVGNSLRTPEYLRLSVAAILAIVAINVVTYLTGRAGWWSLLPVPALVAVGSSGLIDPVAGTALTLASAVLYSLYGSTLLWVLRVLLAMVAVPAGVAISPQMMQQPISWHSPDVIGVVPQILLFCVLTRTIHLALLRQERTTAREVALARAGRDMLEATDIESVHRIGRRTSESLLRLVPGAALLILHREPAGLQVVERFGGPADLSGAVVDDPAELAAAVPGYRHWYTEALGATAELHLMLGSHTPVPDDVRDAFRALSYQVMLGENACRARAELEHLANHDHLTQLPTRAKFLGAVRDALDAGGPVAVLSVDLDGFKEVNDRYGHAVGDELLVALAQRLTAGSRGLAARFGGDEFAILLTGSAHAEEVARRMCSDLAGPVRREAATVTVGASIGVATAEPGVTVAELMKRADEAMYAAKTTGKNHVEAFAA
jgi:diguanylate cyclase (GGDEF)-like protein